MDIEQLRKEQYFVILGTEAISWAMTYLLLFIFPTHAILQQMWLQVPTVDEHLPNLRKKERKSGDVMLTGFVCTTQESDKKEKWKES